ncbi:VWA domain-containing protein [Marinobacter nanhaiticus D15-8W]|uniref:VWA domain-containing protein n=1 Tax=Marinobacter nanhaiticus D15-8W TaxID=626887 RepID=N6VUX0_9GAMM|nr:VWA domain-containing protein [Marinobacter nanhaiticus]ENO13975.1 VWA domain-containing protein [Marinobacter nanhaiticus D15-8W]BES71353.1 VWA domain-containing protein [Marinobacter nanhaiticus D15-8W]
MIDWSLLFSAFHFIRPWWLLLLPLIIFLWWRTRRIHRSRVTVDETIAPHLREALTVGSSGERRWQAIDGVALSLVLAVFGAAGPTWSRQPDPFVAQSAPVVVVLKVTPSMQQTDVAPSRLERGKQKIRDLLDRRTGARTALVAYAGTAHRVVPMTEDPAVMVPYLEGLEPDVMPKEGEAAETGLQLAMDLLERETEPGGILFILDELAGADAESFNEPSAPSIAVLTTRPSESPDRGLDLLSVPVVTVTPDDEDLDRIERALNSAYRQALLENVDQPWLDRGHWLAWPAALLMLLWFRRGWTMRWSGLAVMATLVVPAEPARADGWIDWFLTPDQQGQLAFHDRDFSAAAEHFIDPLWRGYALYRNGQYEEAVTTLDRIETAQAAFIQGMAHIKSRGYRDAVRSFETTLQRDPNYPNAQSNLDVAREIVDYIERTREQSDTGEEQLGADEVVFDNESNRGAETQMEVPQEQGDGPLLSTEQWMNTVDTRTGDFLRQRFMIEARDQEAP